MTRVSPELDYELHSDSVLSVSVDVSFPANGFPKYKIGPNNEIVEEPKRNPDSPPLKEVVVQETQQLAEQHKRLSVRDLATKFDKNLSAAAKLSDEVIYISLFFCLPLSVDGMEVIINIFYLVFRRSLGINLLWKDMFF